MGRDPSQYPTPFFMNASPWSSPVSYLLPRPHWEAVDYGTMLTSPLGPSGGFNGPVAPGMTPASATAAPATVLGPGTQSAPIPSAQPVQPSGTLVADGTVGDHAGPFAVGPLPRVFGGMNVEPSRPIPTHGRPILATTLPHPTSSPAPTREADLGPGAAPAIPSPHGADLIAEALPMVGDSLEKGLEEFVRQLESVDVAGLVARGPAPIAVASAAVLGAAASAIVVREIVRRRSARGRGLRVVDSLGREFALSFPELPRSWSENR